MWKWLARRVAAHLEPPPAPRSATPDLGAAMQTLLVDAVRANGEALAVRTKSDAEFLAAMGEIRNKTAAQALGSKGGKERARRAAEARKVTTDETYCPVCKHDNARASASIIRWHINKHSGPRPPMAALPEQRQYDKPRKTPTNSRPGGDGAMQPEPSEHQSEADSRGAKAEGDD